MFRKFLSIFFVATFMNLFSALPVVADNGEDVILTVYGVARTYNFCVYDEADDHRFINSVDFTAGDCAASACCQVSMDGGALDDCDNQPTALAGGCYNFTASAAELAAAQAKYFIVDAAVAERFVDKSLSFITHDNASAWFDVYELKADVSALALEANVEGYADAALASYDGPTDTEMVAAFTEIKGATWAATDSLEAIRDRGDAAWLSAVVAGYALEANVEGHVNTALATYDGPTDTEMVAAFTEIKGATWAATDSLEAIRDRGDAAWLSAVVAGYALEANVEGHVDAALATYDGPTFTEMDNEFTIVKADLDNPTQYMADVSALATQISVDAVPDAAEINAEVVDVMATDTHAELAACPTATASYDTIMRYALMLQRNKITESGGVQTIMKDDGSTGLCTFTTTDDGITFTRGEGS